MPTVKQATAATKAKIAANKSGASKETIRSISSKNYDSSGNAISSSSSSSSGATEKKSGLTSTFKSRSITAPETTEIDTTISTDALDEEVKDNEDAGGDDIAQDGDSTFSPRLIYGEDEGFQAEDQDTIQRRMTRDAQSEINSIRDYGRSLLSEQAELNDKADRSTAARSTLSGLAGSSEADVAQAETSEKGRKANERISTAVESQVQGILSDIRKSSVTEAREQRNEARLDEASRIASRAARRTEASESIKNLSVAGVTVEGLKKTDPKGFEYLAKQFGSEEALRGAFILNTPQDQILDKKVQGSKYIISKQNPITGKISVEVLDIPGLPPDFSQSVDLGDRVMFYDPSDPTKQFFVGKGLTPTEAAKNQPSEDAATQKAEALALAQELRLDTAVGKKAAVGSSWQKLIPGAKEAGLQGNRVAFEARVETLKSNLTLENLALLKGAMSDKDLAFLNAIGSSLDVNMSEEQFNKELDRVIEKLGGGGTSSSATGGSKTLIKDGQSYDASDMTQEEYDQAIADGYTPG